MKVERERKKIPRDEWLALVLGEIDPLKYAGEGWFSTEEYPTQADVGDPWVQADIGREDDYYPAVLRAKDEREALLKLLRRM